MCCYPIKDFEMFWGQHQLTVRVFLLSYIACTANLFFTMVV